MHASSLRTLSVRCFALALAACAAEVKDCPVPEGQFQFEYIYMSGNCAPIPPTHPIKLEPGTNGIYESRENRSADQVNTRIIYKGCDISIDYRVSTKADPEQGVLAEPISWVSGDMAVEGESELKGMVTRVDYDPPGSAVCTGQYEATLSKNDSTIGAAAD